MPVAPKPAAQEAEKNASRARSTIRRQRTMRDMNSRVIAYERNRQMRAAAAAINNEPLPLSAERLVPLERSLEAAMTRFRNRAPPLIPHYMGQDLSPRSRPAVPRIGRDNDSQDQPSTTLRDDEISRVLPLPVPTPPPAGWSAGSAERADLIARLWPPGQRWDGPDRHVTSDSLRRSALQRPPPPPSPYIHPPLASSQNNSSSALPALTPEFAPARHFSSETEMPRQEASRPSNISNSPWAYEVFATQLNITLSDLIFSQEPALADDLPSPRDRRRVEEIVRRMENRRRQVRARLDGLGDRDRSISPEGEADGTWDTLLTTITPDPQPPSVGSSFASTSAGASSRSQPRSASTPLSSFDFDPAGENICDVEDFSDLSSDTDADEDDHENSGRLDEDTGELFWQTYADVASAARAGRALIQNNASGPDSLNGMQRIISRLARREDIPDEWWTEVGLSRTLTPSASSSSS